MDIKISIIIPCYNVEKYIQQCFYSIDIQLKKEYEVIFINDGSSDNTGDILENLKAEALNSESIKVIHQENRGLSETRNIGIDLASGKYISFIDSDDWIADTYFKDLLKIELGYDLVICSYNRVFNLNSIPRMLNIDGVCESQFIKRRIIGLINDELTDPSQADSLVTLWGKIYRLDIIRTNNIKIENVTEIGSAEDLLFNLEYLNFCRGKSFVLDKPLYYYRKDNVNSFTSNYRNKLRFQWLNLFDKISKFCVTKIEKQAFSNRIALSIIGLGLNELGNPSGKVEIVKNLKGILIQPIYMNAYSNLEMKFLPLHWKLFFLTAKYKKIYLLYFLLKGINYMINKNNK